MKLHDGSSPPADGLCFVVQSNNEPKVGKYGAGLGFCDVPNSYGVEFDIWKNTGSDSSTGQSYDDPNANHVAIVKNGDNTHAAGNGDVVDSSLTFNLYNSVINVWVEYDGNTLYATYGPDATRTSASNRSISRVVGDALNNQDVYAGFSASTGGSYADHDILAWYFKDSYVAGGLSPNAGTYTQGANSIDIALNAVTNPTSATITVKDGNNANTTNEDVKVYLDGVDKGMVNTGPAGTSAIYSISGLAIGAHTIKAVAASGGATDSETFEVTVTSEAVAETLTPVAGSTDDITLTVKNSDGTTQTNFNGPKTVTISGVLPAPDNSYGSFNDTVLTGSQTVVDAVYFTNGVATVPLVLNKAGSTHTIGFYINDGAVPATNSLAITPVAGDKTALKEVIAPVGGNRKGTTAVLLKTQPQISIVDAYGNIRYDCGDEVAATVFGYVYGSDTTDWTIDDTVRGVVYGAVKQTVVNGVVTYAHLTAASKTDTDITGAKIYYTDGSLTLKSSPFNLIEIYAEAAAATLSPAAGSTDNITLTVKNGDGTTNTDFSGSKSVTILGVLPAPDNSYGSFNGQDFTGSSQTGEVNFTGGVATVPLVLNKAGSTHIIAFSIPDVDNPDTNTLDITPVAGTAASLKEVTAPVGGVRSGTTPVALSTQPQVSLIDAHGNTCSTGASSSDTVTASVSSNGIQGWAIGGTVSPQASGGVVTYSDLTAAPNNNENIYGAIIRYTDGSLVLDSSSFNLHKSRGGGGSSSTPAANNTPNLTTDDDSTDIFLKEPDGTFGLFGDYSKIHVGSDTGGVQASVDNKGHVTVANAELGKNYTMDITYELKSGIEIIIGQLNIAVDSNGNVTTTKSLIDPYGTITDAVSGEAVSGVDVELFYADTARNKSKGITPGTKVDLPAITGFQPSDNANPQYSNDNGQYAYMVYPNTDYYLVAKKTDYNLYTSPVINVADSIVKFDFAITPTVVRDFVILPDSSPTKIQENSQFSLNLQYINKRDTDCQDTVVRLDIPEGYTIVDPAGGTLKDGVISWNIGLLKAGGKGSINVMLKAPEIDADRVIAIFKSYISSSNSVQFKEDDDATLKLLIYSNRFTHSDIRYIRGYQDNTFRPDNTITRAEIAAIFARIMNLKSSVKNEVIYTDVAKNFWAAEYIEAVSRNGIFEGYADKTFRPNNPITKAELATVIAKFLDTYKSGQTPLTEAHFKDIDSSYAKNCIEALYRYGVIEGNGGGNFNPDAYITRIETVKMINRMLFRGPLNDASSSFKDISGSYKDLGDVEESTRTHEATISSDGTETMTKYIQESLW